MLIPHLHFCGNCEEAIVLYEKAFNTKVDEISCADNKRVDNASMKIHGQTIFLNDNEMLREKEISHHFPVHLIIQFNNKEELLACYEILKDKNENPFVKTSYSELVGNFTDKFGIVWGFMVNDIQSYRNI
jgi:PhnB protein